MLYTLYALQDRDDYPRTFPLPNTYRQTTLTTYQDRFYIALYVTLLSFKLLSSIRSESGTKNNEAQVPYLEKTIA